MTRSDDVINEDGHDVIAAHTRVVRGMAAALAAIAATGSEQVRDRGPSRR